MAHKINKVKVHLSLPAWLKEESERLAAERGYSMSELASLLIDRWLAENQRSGVAPTTTTGVAPAAVPVPEPRRRGRPPRNVTPD